ncbi:MAG: beta-ketoacyl-[acyl-carrier-protein] synthase family protein [Saprospiraceae bacterium]|nr:beta-ketoacyl-[acyl-carrier-protein] synthase family protein [Saprospiraceae bacterium]
MRIFVTGIGVVSALGDTVQQNWNALKTGNTGIQWSDRLGLMVGEVKQTNESIMRAYALPQVDFSRTTLLALIAAKTCWGENRLVPTLKTGLVAATSAGGLDRMEEYYFRHKTDPDFVMNTLMTHDNGRTTDRLANLLGMNGFVGTISTACSSGANAIMHGARLIRHGRLDRALVGGSDPLTSFNLKGFGSLMIYDPDICKPFDANRKGLNMGEGGAFLLLESERSLVETGNKPLCELTGWCNATDAYHQTASSPEGVGASITMQGCLRMAGITAEQVNYVNAHGTGTGNNDLSETAALKKVFGVKTPPFSSTKGFTGHTLAAAGAVEAVFSVMAILENALLPNANFTTPMPETDLLPVTTFKENAGVEYALSNSFGFGGNCTSLLFKRHH